MRQLSLQVINNIPSQALGLYTDGSKLDSGRTGSGVYAKAEDGLVFRCRFLNPDNCSVFRSDLLAIREALDFALRFETSDIYILTDCKSSIRYLKNWPKIPEKTGQEIVSKIVTLLLKSRVCIQWFPSHVGVFGNEVADLLAKEGSALPSAASVELFTSEIFSIQRAKANSTWKVSPAHEWYAGNRPGLSLQSEVQDPHRLYWPDFVVAISKAWNSSTKKRFIPLALVPALLLLLMSLTVLAPLRGCCGVRGN
ncbi:hypothetical protein AVEN_240578-1 [Araneus ventricosus]|uniref:ribonuclease H n=1 Tax=Araneus ventricosus TaxID=182803 RepID=A0A4Y2GV49_ARAVE|nr:hypothetical protein AVEN_240578-1 [Araneus ventricosus]